MKIQDLHKKIISRWPDWYCQINQTNQTIINEHGYNSESYFDLIIYEPNGIIKVGIFSNVDKITFADSAKFTDDDITFLNNIRNELRTENTTNS